MAQADQNSNPTAKDYATSVWNRAILRGVRANDLAGKAGEVAAELEDRLVRGTYNFGEKLSIYTLAEEFGASRQPVASAVQYLATIGYLEIIPQVGCRVVSPSIQDVEDFFALFARTEALIARYATERHSASEVEELLAIDNELSINPFETNANRRAMADGISHFHDQMSVMARSPILVDRISNFRRIFRFYLSQNRADLKSLSGKPDRMNMLRKQVASAIQARNVADAEAHMEEYILDGLLDWARVV